MSDAQPAPGKPAGMAEDFLDVFVSPAELFRRRSDAKFGLALVVLIVATALLYFATKGAMQPLYEAEFTRNMPNANLTPEQAEAGKRMAGIFGAVGVIVITPIAVFILGLVVMLVGRAMGARISYAQGATIATFSAFPRLLGFIAGGVQALLMDESSLTAMSKVSLGVARFFDPASTGAVTMALGMRVEVFTLWATVLIAIGLREMGKITGGQAAGAAIVVWLLGAIPTVLPALLRS
jgi:hypothetical protein